jgi:hypothetical protein
MTPTEIAQLRMRAAAMEAWRHWRAGLVCGLMLGVPAGALVAWIARVMP